MQILLGKRNFDMILLERPVQRYQDIGFYRSGFVHVLYPE